MILVVAAMQEEIKLIKQHIMKDIKILLTGVGKVNAAMVLADFLAKNEVDAIYNLGFAGATQPFDVGDLVMVTEASYHDFDLSIFGFNKGQVPGFPTNFTSDMNLIKKIDQLLPNIKTGHLYTGDYFMTENLDDACLLDMEGTALYQVAYHNHIPIISIKVVSDVMGMDQHYQSYKKFESNLGANLLDELFQQVFKEV
ncbi:MAG: 5'-methylthioadenosine/S-adenosylhomocysteine nucleosidase [Firmicutes bacterium]|nr:5'-methylthioadenosine/S-adenosylhomocysteine nucleosidase [Bacillota bacterium]